MRKGGIKILKNEVRSDTQASLRSLREAGIKLFMDGKPASPEQIAGKCVRENFVYMADYVIAETGKLKEIRYDRIKIQ